MYSLGCALQTLIPCLQALQRFLGVELLPGLLVAVEAPWRGQRIGLLRDRLSVCDRFHKALSCVLCQGHITEEDSVTLAQDCLEVLDIFSLPFLIPWRNGSGKTLVYGRERVSFDLIEMLSFIEGQVLVCSLQQAWFGVDLLLVKVWLGSSASPDRNDFAFSAEA